MACLVLCSHLERDAMAFTKISYKLDYGLHPLDLTLNDGIEILCLDFGEEQEVNGTRVTRFRVLRDERSESLIDVLS